jgi:hypothetical protein
MDANPGFLLKRHLEPTRLLLKAQAEVVGMDSTWRLLVVLLLLVQL